MNNNKNQDYIIYENSREVIHYEKTLEFIETA